MSSVPPIPQHPGALSTRTEVWMDTFVTIGVVADARPDVFARAFAWFRRVEAACSRFDPDSELSRLCERVGEPVPVSPLLYQALAFALAVAEASDGAFDPTVGQLLATRGFDRNYRTGERISTPSLTGAHPTFRDIALDPQRQTITIARPLVLDLGAVAKGLALDLARQELAPLGDCLIEAGGDVAVSGKNPAGEPWHIGVRHPRLDGALLMTLRLTDAAICTSGDYERPARAGTGHHLVSPRSGRSPATAASVTVIAPTAMVADALGTAAFILGPQRGIQFLAAQGVEGLIVTPELATQTTPGFARYIA